jgi:hypothetical protein
MKNLPNEKYSELAYYTLGLQDEYFIHQCLVDAFTAQTANKQTKAISLTFSLVGLYLFTEKNFTGKEVQAFHTLMSNDKIKWLHFELPETRGKINIDMVLQSTIGEARNKMIMAWCHSVWEAFSKNHSEVEAIAAYYLNAKK